MSDDTTTSWALTSDGAELRQGDELRAVVTYRPEDGWSAHRVGDGRRPRRHERFADAVAYVSARAGHTLTDADREALRLPLVETTPADDEAPAAAVWTERPGAVAASAERVARRADDSALVELRLPGHGFYRCRAETLTRMMSDHLPTSAAALRAHVAERAGTDLDAWADVELGALLIVLGEWQDGHEANERGPDRAAPVAAPDERVTAELFAPDAPDEATDYATVTRAGWTLSVSADGIVTASSDDRTESWQAPDLSDFTAWAVREADKGTLSRVAATAMLRQALRLVVDGQYRSASDDEAQR